MFGTVLSCRMLGGCWEMFGSCLSTSGRSAFKRCMCARVAADPGVGWARTWVGYNLDSEAELSCLRTHGQSSLQRGVHCRGVFLGATIAASRALDPANWVAA